MLCPDHYKKLNASVSEAITEAPLDKGAIQANWTINSQILQLLKFSPKFDELLEQLRPMDKPKR